MELHSVPRLSLFHAQKQIRQSPDLLCSFLRSGFTTLCVMATHRNVAVYKNLSGCFDVERIRDSNSGTVPELCQGPRGNTRPIDCSSECLLQGRTTINPTGKFLALSLQWQQNKVIRREEMMQRASLNRVAIFYLARACPVATVLLVATLSVRAQVPSLSKGQQILVDRGMQINGVVALTSDPFHLSTLQSTNFTAPLWAWTSDVSKLGSAPGAPWATTPR